MRNNIINKEVIKAKDNIIYEEAKNGGKHYGVYKNAKNFSKKQIEKSIEGYRNQVRLHKDKIKNPSKYDIGWIDKSEAEKIGLIKKWYKDIERNKELMNVMIGINNEREEFGEQKSSKW